MRLIKFYRKHTILVLTCLLVTMAVLQWGYYAGKEDAKNVWSIKQKNLNVTAWIK